MKTLVLFLAICMTTFTTYAQESNGITINVIIENVLNSEGNILAGLHNSETFMKGQGVDGFMYNASAGEMTFSFKNVNPGTYAISILHDVNSNMTMDFEDNGMPKERYGISGNEKPMGPPTFDGAKFEVSNKDLEVKIRF